MIERPLYIKQFIEAKRKVIVVAIRPFWRKRTSLIEKNPFLQMMADSTLAPSILFIHMLCQISPFGP